MFIIHTGRMDSVVVLILVGYATTQAKSFQYDCNDSDVYMPASDMENVASASGVDDLQQLQYCYIDNCTIMRVDTGQQLYIAYTAQSHLVVTSKDGKIFLLIPKDEPKQFCLPPNTSSVSSTVVLLYIGISTLALIAIISGYTVGIFLFYKELHTTFGKLMMLFNIARTFHIVSLIAILITSFMITVNLTMVCYVLWFSTMQGSIITDASITCCIAFLAYIMHSSYKSIEVRKDTEKRLLKYSMVYIIVLPFLCAILIITYDVGTGTYQHAILPNGHCSYIPESPYTTISVVYVSHIFNKIMQIIFMAVYFTYYYKLKNALKFVHSIATSNRQKDQLYFKLAVAMAATIGISKFLSVVNYITGQSVLLYFIGTFVLLVQQALIMILLTCSKKMAQLCKERFCTTQTPP